MDFDDYPTSELWIGNLMPVTAEDAVREVLGRYGTVHFCHVGSNPRYPLAYAKVTMGSVAEASRVLAALHQVTVPQLSGNNELKVHFARVAAGPPAARSPAARSTAYGATHGTATSLSPREHSSSRVVDAAAEQLGQKLSLSSATSSASSSRATKLAAAAAAVPQNLRCGSCGKPESADVALRRCSACKAIAYCCTACQHADWQQRHSGECGMLRQLAALLGQQPGIASTLKAALEQPASSLGRAVHTLLANRLAALEQQEQEQEQKQLKVAGQEQQAAAVESKEQAQQSAAMEEQAPPAAAMQPAEQAERAADSLETMQAQPAAAVDEKEQAKLAAAVEEEERAQLAAAVEQEEQTQPAAALEEQEQVQQQEGQEEQQVQQQADKVAKHQEQQPDQLQQQRAAEEH